MQLCTLSDVNKVELHGYIVHQPHAWLYCPPTSCIVVFNNFTV